MNSCIPDDIFALYSRFELDEQDYRIFQQPQKATTEIVPGISEPGALENSFEEEKADLPSQETDHPVPEEFSDWNDSPQGARREPIPFPSEVSDNSREELQSLWRHLASSGKHPKARRDSLASSAIKIYGTAGGVGTTTLAAVLAKLLARSDRRCAIVEKSDTSSLPVFFRSQRLHEHKRFFGIQSLFEPRIRILNTQTLGASVKPTVDLIDWVIAETDGDLDHAIFDRPACSSEKFGSGLNVCVAVPDVGSLLGARKLKTGLERATHPGQTLCVLNRFDAENALHQEVRGWYQQNFRELVTVSDSPLVSEALAEGTTVVDWIPEAAVSADFLAVFKAVRSLLKHGSEARALCS